jgi:hypothetical protein
MNHQVPQYMRRAAASLISLGLALSGPIGVAAGSTSQDDEIAALRATVDSLLHRVDELEREVAQQKARRKVSAAPRTSNRPASPPLSQSPAQSSQVAPPASAPGTVDVDELAAQRALERTLTAEGALLLRPKQFDIEPYFDYARHEYQPPTLIVSNGLIAAATQDIRRNEFDAGLRVRAGLPWESQIELDVPYRWIDQSSVQSAAPRPLRESSHSGSTMGDITVGFAKTLLREYGWIPDLVGRITWDTATGDRISGGIPMGIGYDELRFGLTALKRQDPLAFTAGLIYSKSFEKDNIKPGDQWVVSLQASLAASPQTSLSMALVQSFTQEEEIGGYRVPGSTQLSSTLLFGVSSIVGHRTLLSLAAGVGLTTDAPDYTVYLSLPMRF